MISFRNVTKIYSSHVFALKNVSFDVRQNEFILIVGRSGAGKTTLLRLLIREEKPTKGKVLFDGMDISKIKPGNIPQFRRRIGVVFQDYKLLPSKTVYENVAYAMEVTGASDSEIVKDVPEVLDIVGLKERIRDFPHQLSGGEKQRVAIARALVHRPKVIIADEPTGNLDPYNTQDIINLFSRIHELGTTIILSTHHKLVVDSLGKRVITLEDGRLIRDEKNGRFIL